MNNAGDKAIGSFKKREPIMSRWREMTYGLRVCSGN